MSRTFRIPLALLALGLPSCAPSLHVTPSPPESVADLAPDAALHGIVTGWSPARIRRDMEYFEALLAPEFIWRRNEFTSVDVGRREFLDQVRAGWYCGPGLTYQYRIISYRDLGDHVVVNSASTVWVGEPTGTQHEIELLQIFRRLDPAGWQLVEAREVSYTVDPFTWRKPDSDIVPWSARALTNPADLPRKLEYPCEPDPGLSPQRTPRGETGTDDECEAIPVVRGRADVPPAGSHRRRQALSGRHCQRID